jgi:hypothetical protein
MEGVRELASEAILGNKTDMMGDGSDSFGQGRKERDI